MHPEFPVQNERLITFSSQRIQEYSDKEEEVKKSIPASCSILHYIGDYFLTLCNK